jgi:hypothetical protein
MEAVEDVEAAGVGGRRLSGEEVVRRKAIVGVFMSKIGQFVYARELLQGALAAVDGSQRALATGGTCGGRQDVNRVSCSRGLMAAAMQRRRVGLLHLDISMNEVRYWDSRRDWRGADDLQVLYTYWSWK